jgi:hypothetical protein
MKFTCRISALACLVLGAAFAQAEYQLSPVVSGLMPLGPLPALEVRIGHVGGVATDQSGNVYFSSLPGCVFKIDFQGALWRFAGS